MRPTHGSTKEDVRLQASACVAAAMGQTGWFGRRRIRRWIRRSPLHAQEFLLAWLIVGRCRIMDTKRSIDVQALLDEAEQTVVTLKWAPEDHPSTLVTLAERVEPRHSRLSKCFKCAAVPAAVSGPPFRTALAIAVLPLIPMLAPIIPVPVASEFVTGAAETRTVHLGAGSVIYLNERTSITVEQTWKGCTVRLRSGDVFFDIRHNSGRRLQVALAHLVINDVGTRFHVRRLDDEANVSVLEGSVSISGIETPVTVLRSGVEARIQAMHASGQIELQHHDIQAMEQAVIWTKGWLTFDGQTLRDVAGAFNARNRRQLLIADPEIASWRVGGRFLAGDVEGAVESLMRAMPIHVLPETDNKIPVIRLVRSNRRSVGSSVQSHSGSRAH